MRTIKNLFSRWKNNGDIQVVSSAEFKKLVSKYFAPKLREQGWKGTGFHYRKDLGNHVVYFLSFQPSKYGGDFSVEIGIHLDFLKFEEHSQYPLEKMNCHFVEVRRHLSRGDIQNFSWEYQSSEKGNKELLEDVWNAYLADGMDFFDYYKKFPGPFEKIKPEDFLTSNRDHNYYLKGIPFPSNVRGAWYLAQVHNFLGNNEKKREFAKFGLNQIEGTGGSGLRPYLEELMK